MSISSLGARPPSLQETLGTSLQGKGISAEKSSSIGAELENVVKSTMGAGSKPADPASVRQALEQQLSKDVEAGTLTPEGGSRMLALSGDEILDFVAAGSMRAFTILCALNAHGDRAAAPIRRVVAQCADRPQRRVGLLGRLLGT